MWRVICEESYVKSHMWRVICEESYVKSHMWRVWCEEYDVPSVCCTMSKWLHMSRMSHVSSSSMASHVPSRSMDVKPTDFHTNKYEHTGKHNVHVHLLIPILIHTNMRIYIHTHAFRMNMLIYIPTYIHIHAPDCGTSVLSPRTAWSLYRQGRRRRYVSNVSMHMHAYACMYMHLYMYVASICHTKVRHCKHACAPIYAHVHW